MFEIEFEELIKYDANSAMYELKNNHLLQNADSDSGNH